MKIAVVFALLIVAVCAVREYTHGHDGRPGCKTPEEATKKLWRNNFDPTRYWECTTPGVEGLSRTCDIEYLFQDHLNKCVHYLEWVWTPLEDPPSKAGPF